MTEKLKLHVDIMMSECCVVEGAVEICRFVGGPSCDMETVLSKCRVMGGSNILIFWRTFLERSLKMLNI